MGALHTKNKKNDYVIQHAKELASKIESLIKNKKALDVIKYIDEMKRLYDTVDIYIRKKNTILYLIIKSDETEENKYEILRCLFSKYNFDLNKCVGVSGNLLVNSIGHIHNIKTYQLFLDNGSMINSVNYDLCGTALDLIQKLDSENKLLYNFLKGKGAKHINELPLTVCQHCGITSHHEKKQYFKFVINNDNDDFDSRIRIY